MRVCDSQNPIRGVLFFIGARRTLLAAVLLGSLLALPGFAMERPHTEALDLGAGVVMRLSDSLGTTVAAGALQPRIIAPIHGARISSEFGWRKHPILKRMRFHGGVDFAARKGTRVHAAATGKIIKVVRTRDRGLHVLIRHSQRFETAYSHLASVAPGIRTGSEIEVGQVIGTVGNTGRSTGPHLDFETFLNSKRVDPVPLLESREPIRPMRLEMSTMLEPRISSFAQD